MYFAVYSPLKGWNKVTSLLSGQFCASLNFIDKAATVEPKISLRPEGVVVGPVGNSSLFYAALPHEAVCTENLTPWKKLLPCFAKAGLATLLNAVHLFNTNYFSLALDLRPVCRVSTLSLSSKFIRVRQMFTNVRFYLLTTIRHQNVRKHQWSLCRAYRLYLIRLLCLKANRPGRLLSY